MWRHRRLARTSARIAAVLVLLAASAVGDRAPSHLAPAAGAQEQEPEPDFAHPTRHFRVPRPADLSDAQAMSIYDRILDDMLAAYRLSDDPSARHYHRWRRYNRAPYRSATHGERYINNYANATAAAYGRFEGAGAMPPGAVLAKDSFTVTAQGDVFTGPLFLMEKMAPGFSPVARDWRYTMILPDGSVFGTTGGDGAGRVEFCASCHAAAGDAADHLFFVPERYRVRFLDPRGDGDGG